MSMGPSTIQRGAPPRGGAGILLGFGAVFGMFVAAGAVAYLNTTTLNRNSEQVTHTHEVLAALENVASIAKDAETGQRGYLITGDDRYLQPYRVLLGHHIRASTGQRVRPLSHDDIACQHGRQRRQLVTSSDRGRPRLSNSLSDWLRVP